MHNLSMLLTILVALIFTNSWANEGSNTPPAPGVLLNVYADSSRPLTDTHWHATHGAAVVEAHSVHLDLNALQSAMPSSRNVMQRGPLLVGHAVRVVLPKLSQPLTLSVSSVEELVPGVITYSGEAAELPGSFFTFSVENGRLLGKLLIGLASYVIEPSLAEAGKHDLILLDRGLLPAASDALSSPALDESSSSSPSSTQGTTSATMGSGIVRVLFLFANNVTSQSGRAANIISEFNAALARSVVDSTKRVTSAGVLQLDHDFAGLCRFSIRNMMLSRTDPFDTLDSDLEANLADIAFLVVTTDNNLDCPNEGSAGRIGGIAAEIFEPNNPIALSTDTFALGNLNALHEIGHLLGALHANTATDDIPAVASFPSGVYAHGFENDNAGQWQTIMGGFTTPRCEFNFANPDPEAQPCLRIPYFSSLRVAARVRGTLVAIGTDTDTPDTDPNLAINNAQYKANTGEGWLENTGLPVVSGYRQDPPPPSSAPTLEVHPGFCWGQSTVEWSAVSNSDFYQLFSATSSSFSSPFLRFEGAGTFAVVDVPQNSTWYLRVRACNGGGCTGFSNQESASWVNGCF